MNAKSNEEILEMLREFSITCKDKMIIAFGASPYSVKEQCLLTREQLDAVCPNKPVFFIKYDGHACLPTKEGLDICEKYHILLPIQTAFINWPQEPDSYLESILGNRANNLTPAKEFLDRNIVVSLGSDGPCTHPSPLQWIHNAVNHSNKEQAISLEDALKNGHL